MADITISRTYPHTLALRIKDPLLRRVDGVYPHRIYQKLLARRGFTPDEETGIIELAGVTDRAQIEMLIDFMFWQIVEQDEKPAAVEVARQVAETDLFDAFDGGGDE